MPFEDPSSQFDAVSRELEWLLRDMAPENTEAGEAMADAIVQTTLAGIGAGDESFAAYSATYKELIQSVGGKAQQTVNLRGVFYHDGQKRSRSKKDLGQGRRAYVNVGIGDRSFTAMTKETRPARGLTDKLSEMSRDLIKVKATDNQITLTYEPREKDYMIHHNNGTGKAPQREWFSADKAAVKAAALKVVQQAILARIARFNRS